MAVYTEVDDDDLMAFVAQFNIGDLVSYKGIAEGVENSNFLIQTEQGPYILTLYEKRVNEADLPYFLELMQHLAQKDVTCPEPVPTRDGRVLGRLAGRPAAIFTFLQGMWPRKIQPVHCAELGKGLAQLHKAGDDFPQNRPNSLSVNGWRDVFERCRDDADTVMVGLEALIEQELSRLEQEWPQNLPTGVIHADAFPDNIFFRGTHYAGMIDFYFACTDMYVYDLAICMNAWCFEKDGDFNVTKARLLLSNYRKTRDFSPEELAALPTMARGAAMRFLLTRLYDWINTPKDAFVKPKDPLDYVHILKFHQHVTSSAAYGLD